MIQSINIQSENNNKYFKETSNNGIKNLILSGVFRLQEKQDKLTIYNIVPDQALQENTNKSYKPVLHVFILKR